MKHFVFMFVMASCALAFAADPTTQPVDLKAWCVTPTNNPNPQRHAEFLERAKDKKIELLFMGDSITWAWQNAEGGLKTWEKFYLKYNVANFGVPGETTADTLGHIEGGVLDGLKPKVVVLLIGTNNLGGGVHSDWIAAGIEKIVNAAKEKMPGSRMLVVGIFPRGKADNEFRWRIDQVNGFVSKLDDSDRIRYLNVGPKFLDDRKEYKDGLTRDHLHLTPEGYEIWAVEMQPLLDEMMNAPPK